MAVTVKAGPAVPTVKVALAALVMAAAWPTVSVKVCVAFVPTPLLAFTVRLNTPLLPIAAVPLSRPALFSVKPVGRALAVLKVGTG